MVSGDQNGDKAMVVRKRSVGPPRMVVTKVAPPRFGRFERNLIFPGPKLTCVFLIADDAPLDPAAASQR